MPDALFEFLFKYPRIAYEAGEIVWGGTWSPGVVLSGLGAGGVLVAVSYLRTGGSAGRALLAVRLAGLAVLGLCLLRPTLVVSTAVPQQNVVAVLVDDSRSMELADVDGRSRGEVARELFATPGSPLRDALEDRFLLRHYRFSAGTERIEDPADLTFRGTRTRIGPALDQVRRDLQALPLAGIVLVTDGGDQDPGALEDAILALRSEGVPVHAVGVGNERLEPDVEIERVEMPSSVIRGSTVVADVVVAHRGLDRTVVPVRILEDGRILASEEVELPRGGGSVTARIPVTLEGWGVRSLRVAVPPQAGELMVENNHRDVHVRVRSEPERILYFEGEPRSEVAFLRRALRTDDALRLVVLQRTGEDRYLWLGMEGPEEAGDERERLADGFPRTRDELFRYRALVLGSVEASYFTPDQLRMIAEFVDRRGGGLLALGGWSALGEGGYAGTALAPVLPVDLEGGPPPPPEARVRDVKVGPTQRGETHPVGRLGADGGAAVEGLTGWAGLPPLTSVNRVGPPRPGATVILEGRSPEGGGGPHPILASQRYGAGTASVWAVQDTWTWQMHADIPLEDRTYETFWRQLLRWLVQEVPEPVSLDAVRDRVAPDEPVELVAQVRDSSYLPVNDARVTAVITDPVGGERELALAWSLERDGEYRGSFVPDRPGPYEVRARVERPGSGVLPDSPSVHVEAGVLDLELGSGAMRGDLLRRIAEETGGRFHTLEGAASQLPEAVRYTGSGTVVQEERDLWDAPILFLLLVGLLSAEWLVRRRRGMA
jgi:uncharacterized membrane protein